MRGTKLYLKREIQKTKMQNKMNEMSGSVIESFRSSLDDAYNRPLDNDQLLKHALSKLGLRDEGQLAGIVIKEIDKEWDQKRH